MSRVQRAAIFVAMLIFAASAAFAQGPALSSYYVSGGAFVYQVSGAKVTTVLNKPGANFESLAIGPDWVDQDAFGNAAHPALLYVCDTNLNQVIRFDPANSAVRDVVYNNSVPNLTPVCGRSSAASDFYITNKAGTGVYKFAGVANVALGSLGSASPTAVSSFSATKTGAGITQKNVGDLLVVDSAENKVLRAAYAGGFSSQVTLISSQLSAPVGIARFSNGDVFVANSSPTSGKNPVTAVSHFSSSGAAAGTCASLTAKTNDTPEFLGAAENDVLYLVTEANSSSTVWTWDATHADCALTAGTKIPTPVSGIAVPPVSTSTITAALTGVVDPNLTPFFFNSHAFQIQATGCNASVTAYPISPATVNKMIQLSLNPNSLPDGGVAATNLGEGGYSIAYVAKWQGCGSIYSDGAYVAAIYALLDDSITNNPRILRCEGSHEPAIDASTSCQPVSMSDLQMVADYPLGGIIPQDYGGATRTTSNSTFVMINANSGPGTAEAGTFCGYQSPLVNTLDPKLAAVFSAGAKNTLSVKFKMVSANGSCQNGNFITDSKALISVAQIADGHGNTVFHPVNILSTSVGLADQQPLYNTGNQQFQFTLNLAGYAPGVYSLTTTLLSDNTSHQSIVFKIK